MLLWQYGVICYLFLIKDFFRQVSDIAKVDSGLGKQTNVLNLHLELISFIHNMTKISSKFPVCGSVLNYFSPIF